MRDLKDAVGTLPQTTNRIVEQIQAAAVLVANLEIELYGVSDAEFTTHGKAQVDEVLELIRLERLRQDELWGPQKHNPVERLLILLEEVGEIAEEIDFDGDADPELLVLETRLLGEKAKAVLDAR